MILSIVPELTFECIKDSPPNVKVIDYKLFNSLEIHPFIATNTWERIDITLGKGIKGGYIKQVLTRCNIVRPIIPRDLEIDFEIISRLMEILQDKSSELRGAFMKKEDVYTILIREGVIFE